MLKKLYNSIMIDLGYRPAPKPVVTNPRMISQQRTLLDVSFLHDHKISRDTAVILWALCLCDNALNYETLKFTFRSPHYMVKRMSLAADKPVHVGDLRKAFAELYSKGLLENKHLTNNQLINFSIADLFCFGAVSHSKLRKGRYYVFGNYHAKMLEVIRHEGKMAMRVKIRNAQGYGKHHEITLPIIDKTRIYRTFRKF